MNLFRLALGVIVSLLSIASSSAAERSDFILGVDANYALEMKAKGAAWKWNGQGQELFARMHEQGVQWLRVRLWTGNDGVNGKSYATQVVERASKARLTPYVVIFL